MIRHIQAAALSIILSSALAGAPALAQSGDPETLGPSAPDLAPQPDPEAPKAPDAQKPVDLAAAKQKAVDELLGRLAKTEEPVQAKRIASAVQALWLRSGSDTIDLLTARSTQAQRAQKVDVAIKLMNEVLSQRPDFVEGWNRRATLHFVDKDYDDAMADLHEVLIREPRHYGAWVGLGRILSESGLDARALAAYRKALEIYPAIDGLKKQVDELALKVEGQPI